MANRKISDLTALTAPVTGDLLPIVDISEAAAADKNKKITYGTFLSSVPLGTAAAPSIAFTGDTNTGIYSPGADQVAISIGGTEKLIVKSDGLVGIGTSSPANRITAAGAEASVGIFNTTAGSTASPSFCKLNFYGYLEDSTWNVASISAGNSASNTYAGILRFATNTTGGTHTTALTIDNEQRVGIGTTSPGSLLHLADAGHITVGTTTGTKIGTATTQKIGFYNTTPVVQPAAVANATTAVDVITQFNDLLAKLRTLGIIAT